jgi:hypothetical protein
MSVAAEHTLDAPAEIDPIQFKTVFADAVTRCGLVERSYLVCQRHVQLRFAGSAMLKLADAMEHLEVDDPGEPELTINVWDVESTGAQPPVGVDADPQRPLSEAELRVLWLWQRQPLRALLQPRGRRLSVMDESKRTAWFSCTSAAELPYWEYTTPFAMIVHCWLATIGAIMVHASAVGTEEGGVLIVGPSGSGKSTTALLCLEAGLGYAGDDHVAVELRDGGAQVHSVYATGKLVPGGRLTSPKLETAIINRDQLATEKAVILISRFAPDRLAAGFPLRAVLVPRVTGSRETVLTPLARAAALARLAPSTILQLPGTPAADLRAMASIVRAVPSFALQLGTEATGVTNAIREAIHALSRNP